MTPPHDRADNGVLEAEQVRRIAIAGNPNAGKSTVFNLLTGMRQRVGNYPGVTVERKSGSLVGHEHIEIIDLPGTYSLSPKSLDEQIAYDALANHLDGEAAPDLVVVVVSASNLERNLYLASQVLDLDLPTVIVLNMMDEVEKSGLVIQTDQLSHALGVPVLQMVATKKQGLDALRDTITGAIPAPGRTQWRMPEDIQAEINLLAGELADINPDLSEKRREAECLRILTNDRLLKRWETINPAFFNEVHAVREKLDASEVQYGQAEATARYLWLGRLAKRVTKKQSEVDARRLTDRLDAFFVHRAFGPLIFVGILLLVFQAIFTWATPLMDLTESGMLGLGSFIRIVLPANMATDLLVDGVIAGVGNVIIFLPQILLLFFFLSLMESTGYMARSAFIMDRVMRRFGLSGGSVMPMMSAFACAVPAIMATRTMENQRDRFLTIMVVPLLSCSARLPVYTLFIAAFIPATTIWGPFDYQGVTMLGLYVFGTSTAFWAAWVLKKVMMKGPESFFMLELPPYRAPQWKVIFWRMIERAKMFVLRAGKVIFLFSILLWFAATFPKSDPDPQLLAQRSAIEASLSTLSTATDTEQIATYEAQLSDIANAEAAYQMEHSAIGQLGHFIEPVMRPLGFDWKLSAGIISAFAAREVIIGALGTIFSVGDADENSVALREHLQDAKDPETGEPMYSTLIAFSLLIFFVLALQCMSTLAIAKRELNSWKWPAIMWLYMTGLAYLASFIVYQGGLLLGWG
ncbi:MAG: ferrous iron transport protein B [Rhodothermales bacterium]